MLIILNIVVHKGFITMDFRKKIFIAFFSFTAPLMQASDEPGVYRQWLLSKVDQVVDSWLFNKIDQAVNSKPMRYLSSFSEKAQRVDQETVKVISNIAQKGIQNVQSAAIATWPVFQTGAQKVKEKTTKVVESAHNHIPAPVIQAAAFTAVTTSMGYPNIATMGVILGGSQALSIPISNAINRGQEQFNTSIREANAVVHSIGNKGSEVITGIGSQGERTIEAIGGQGERAIEAINQAVAHQQQVLTQTFTGLNTELNKTAAQTVKHIQAVNQDIFRDNISLLCARLVQAGASAATIGIGAALTYKHLMQHHGRKSTVLATVGALMVVAPPIILNLLKSNTPNSLASDAQSDDKGKEEVENQDS